RVTPTCPRGAWSSKPISARSRSGCTTSAGRSRSAAASSSSSTWARTFAADTCSPPAPPGGSNLSPLATRPCRVGSWFDAGGGTMQARAMLRASIAVVCLFTLGEVTGAAEKKEAKPKPDATLTLTAKQVSAGVGYSWGEGKLKYKGKTYPVDVDGLTVVTAG